MTDRRFSGTPGMTDVIREATEDRLRALHTALPGEVKEWDPATQTVTVKPLVHGAVQDADGRYVTEELPEIYDVPVMFPRTAAGYITFPIVPGDTVLLVFCERSIGQWRYTGRPGSPGDQRAHSLGSAVAIPGLYATRDELPASAFPGAGITVVAGTVETRLGDPTATDHVALATLVVTEFDRVWDLLSTWTVVPNDGGGALQTAALLASAGRLGVAATKVKAK